MPEDKDGTALQARRFLRATLGPASAALLRRLVHDAASERAGSALAALLECGGEAFQPGSVHFELVDLEAPAKSVATAPVARDVETRHAWIFKGIAHGILVDLWLKRKAEPSR